jgi:DNA-directed RNA polymerase specialized sigma24 family protein
LHYFLGMPLPEAAAILNIPLGTAKSRLHRSLSAMRAGIESDLGPEMSQMAPGHLA